MEFISQSEEETELLGKMLGRALPENTVICFEGELGTGKTTLIRGMAAAITGIGAIEISSPTYTYLHIYEGKKIVYHFDLYRLNNASEFAHMGFNEYFDHRGICCIEWSEKIQGMIPKGAMKISMEYAGEYAGEEGRRITIT